MSPEHLEPATSFSLIDSYEQFKPVFDLIPKVETELHGDLWAPRNLSELAILIETMAGFFVKEVRMGWRGQGNVAWPIDSTAVRWIHKATGEAPLAPERLREIVAAHEDQLIAKARAQGFAASMRDATRLELLASLRHHGAGN